MDPSLASTCPKIGYARLVGAAVSMAIPLVIALYSSVIVPVPLIWPYIDHVPVPGAPSGNGTLWGTGRCRDWSMEGGEGCTRGGVLGGSLGGYGSYGTLCLT